MGEVRIAEFHCSFCTPCKLSRTIHIKIVSPTVLIRTARMRGKGDFVSRYKVMVDDNFHYMEEDERYEVATLSTIEEAMTACKRIVDNDLSALAKGKNYTPDELYEHYVSFGSDPFIVALDPKDDRPCFSAWDYAKERSQVLSGQKAIDGSSGVRS
jgi:hypothetical protein